MLNSISAFTPCMGLKPGEFQNHSDFQVTPAQDRRVPTMHQRGPLTMIARNQYWPCYVLYVHAMTLV